MFLLKKEANKYDITNN